MFGNTIHSSRRSTSRIFFSLPVDWLPCALVAASKYVGAHVYTVDTGRGGWSYVPSLEESARANIDGSRKNVKSQIHHRTVSGSRLFRGSCFLSSRQISMVLLIHGCRFGHWCGSITFSALFGEILGWYHFAVEFVNIDKRKRGFLWDFCEIFCFLSGVIMWWCSTWWIWILICETY